MGFHKLSHCRYVSIIAVMIFHWCTLDLLSWLHVTGAIMTIDKSLYELPLNKKNILLASESAEEEAQMELDSLLEQFKEWKKDNKGGWKDFLKSDRDKPRVIKLKKGGRVPISYGKIKEPSSVKRIDLRNELLKMADMYSKLSSEEIKTLNWMHKKMFPKD